MSKNNKCPRCKSGRISERLDGSRYCKRCGQRWSVDAEKIVITPSYDRREMEKNKLTPKEQVSIIKNKQGGTMDDTEGKTLVEVFAAETVKSETTVEAIRRGRGRPKLPVGTTVTRSNGTFTKGEDGKFHKTKA